MLTIKEHSHKTERHKFQAEECISTVQGVLEAINVHNSNNFIIYPSVGPKQISCSFKESLLPTVINAIRKRVEVTGLTKYKKNSCWPHHIQAEKITIYPGKAELPSFDDIKGMAPNLTEGMPSEEYIRKMRDEEWE